jgi:superfamily II DNA/RNA helicase
MSTDFGFCSGDMRSNYTGSLTVRAAEPTHSNMSAGMAAEGCAFRDLPLHADVARALAAMGFARPSPIQLRALPVALFGNDVVGQAKSGTGKTAVFGVAAVEQAIRREETQRRAGDAASMERSTPSALILAPTREIAVQIESVLRQLAQFRPDVRVCACIGGLPVAHDQRRLRDDCSIVVGTPGRVKALIELRALACHSLRLFVLDEVDKLLAKDFDKEVASPARGVLRQRSGG